MLLNQDIHIWEVNLDRGAAPGEHRTRAEIRELSDCLTEQERQRAAKFINPLHGNRWTVARGYLRQILSRYVNLPPDQIVFTYGQQGKPELEGNPIQFNLSHSHDRAVYGISATHPIGIDLEQIHSLAAAELVERFFSVAERAMFHTLPVSAHQAAFFHAWTQKEAYLKACGTGLSTSLDLIEVSIDPQTPAQIISSPRSDRTWQIRKLELSPDYAGAVVVGGEFNSIVYQKPVDILQ
jgi:4'-phosphopantetheinyl transferase